MWYDGILWLSGCTPKRRYGYRRARGSSRFVPPRCPPTRLRRHHFNRYLNWKKINHNFVNRNFYCLNNYDLLQINAAARFSNEVMCCSKLYKQLETTTVKQILNNQFIKEKFSSDQEINDRHILKILKKIYK